MKNRIICLLMCLVMVVSLLPTIVLAEDEVSVYVGGKALTDGQYIDNDGNISTEQPSGGYAYFDEEAETLTLNNYSYSGTGYEHFIGQGFTYSAAIYSEYDLYLVLEGENSITNTATEGEGVTMSDSELYISGSGTLDITADYGIYCYCYRYYCGITISGGTTNINSSQGIYLYGDVIIEDGTLNIEGDGDGLYTRFSDIEIYDGTVNIDVDGIGINTEITYITVYDGTVNIKGGEYGISCDDMDLTVYGGNVTISGDYTAMDATNAIVSPEADNPITVKAGTESENAEIDGSPFTEEADITSMLEGVQYFTFTVNKAEDILVYSAETDAPAYVQGDTTTFTIVTDSNVGKVALFNENGKYIAGKTVQKVVDGDKTTWTITSVIGTKGSRTVNIYAAREDGNLVDSGVSVSFIIDIAVSGNSEPIKVLAVKSQASAMANNIFTITVETTLSTTKVGIFDANTGNALGKVSQAYTDKDDVRTLTIVTKVGTAGYRSFNVKATDISGVWSESVPFDIDIVK